MNEWIVLVLLACFLVLENGISLLFKSEGKKEEASETRSEDLSRLLL